jgi:hydantoinase/carbamoylase family amidase
METRLERIVKDIETISKFNGTPDKGVTRFTYSDEDKLARDYLLKEMRDLNLLISIDGVGNIRARMEGNDKYAPAVMVGSHIDSVKNGGKYDGVIGVVGALEAIRVLKESGYKNTHPIELVIFSEEEGSNFSSTLAGSKGMVGKYTMEDTKKLKNANGKTMYDMAKDFGLEPDTLPQSRLLPGELKAMLELHIEQSVVLEREKVSIGIVEAIAGMKSLRITFRGVANHAGATPMGMRHDPMVAAGEIIVMVEKIVKEKGYSTTVGTVGRINCIPNVPNVIPGEVSFSVDIRDVKVDSIDTVVAELEGKTKEIAASKGVDYEFLIVGESKPVILSKEIIDIIEKTVKDRGYSYKNMNSGAVHDSCMLADLTKVGMIFVPSVNGRSHVPEEFTSYEDIKMGCDVLLGTIMELSK